MLLNDGMVKYHTTGDISVIQMEDGKGISISSDGNIELLANNINLKTGAKLNITAGKKIEISCIGSSMIIDGEEDRIDKKAPDIFFDSPENVIVDMPVDAIEQLFASQAAERKASVLEFTPDEIRITAENKFDDGIYQLLYGVWKETSGEYDPKDDKPIVDPRGNTTTKNETKFKYWAMEQYGMTAEEYRGYTFKGTGKTILETAGAYFKVTAPIDAKKGITYLVKKGVTSKNVLKAAFGMTDDVAVAGDLILESKPYTYFRNISKRKDIDPNGYIDVIAHGAPNRIQIEINGISKMVDHRYVGRILKHSDSYTGQKIRLLSCNTGLLDNGFAQNLANYMNVEVIAPTKYIWAYSNGKHIVAGGNEINGRLVMSLEEIGEMKKFFPGKIR